jgi:hypothetical protein
MTIQLGDLVLPDVLWTDRRASVIESQTSKTLTGNVIVWEQSTHIRPITLSGGEDYAWISAADLDTLFAMSQVPNATYELIYEGETHLVRFRNEEPPAVDAVPISGRPNEASTDEYKNLIIKLMEV